MAVETKDLIAAAEKLGQMITEHPAMKRYIEARKGVDTDPEASRLFGEFDQLVMTLAQQEQSGQPISEGQRQKLRSLQQTISTNLKVKAFSLAQYDLTEILRQVSQAWQKPVAKAQGAGREEQPAAAAGPKLIYPG